MCCTLQYNVYPETCCVVFGGWMKVFRNYLSDYRSNIILTCAKRMQINHATYFNTQKPYGNAITTMNKQDARGKTLIYGERKQATQQQQHHRDREIELRQNDWRDPVYSERRVIAVETILECRRFPSFIPWECHRVFLACHATSTCDSGFVARPSQAQSIRRILASRVWPYTYRKTTATTATSSIVSAAGKRLVVFYAS